MAIARVEVTAEEVDALLAVVRAKLLELERNLQMIEEGEGFDATKWNARRLLLPQVEGYRDLELKLEGARRELRGAKA